MQTELTSVSPVDKVALPRTQKGFPYHHPGGHYMPDPGPSGGRGLTLNWTPVQHSLS